MSDTAGTALALPTEADGAAPKKSKLLPTIAAVGILTLVAIGGGAGVGMLIGTPAAPPAPEAAAAAPAEGAKAETAASEPPAPKAPSVIVKLEPVVTNVTSPPNVLMRVEASIVLDPEQVEDPALLALQIQGDTLTFLRTIDLAQVEGARGLLHLREDLRERAQLRSPAVSDYLIQALIAQ